MQCDSRRILEAVLQQERKTAIEYQKVSSFGFARKKKVSIHEMISSQLYW